MRSTQTRGRATRLGAVLMLMSSVLLVGCLRVDSATTIREDGSGTFRIEVVLGNEVLDAVKPLIGEPSAVQATILRNFTIGDIGETWSNAKVEAPTKGIGFVLSADFADYRETGTALTGGSSPFFRSLEISEEGGNWTLAADVGRLERAPLPAAVVNLSEETLAKLPKPEYTVTFTLPGDVVSSNASSTDGGTATWEFRDDNVTTMTGEWESGSTFSLTAPLIAIGVVTLVSVGAIAFSRVGERNSKRGSKRSSENAK